MVNYKRNRSFIYNSIGSAVQQLIVAICGLVIPRLIIGTYGSIINGTIASITQFIGITALIQGGVTGAARVAFYAPVNNKNTKAISVVYNTSNAFFRRFSVALVLYIIMLATIYPRYIYTGLAYPEASFLIIILGVSSIADSLFGITNQLLLFADLKGYIYTLSQAVGTLLNAIVTVIFVETGSSVIEVKLVATAVLLVRPFFLFFYVRKKYTIHYKEELDWKVLSQSRASISKSIAYFIHNSTDNTVITILMHVAWVSVYSVYNGVIKAVSGLVSSVLGNTEALFGQMIARNECTALQNEVPVYDLMSKMASTCFFSTCMVLIIPFVQIYTSNISDMEYIFPVFGYSLCFAEMVYCMSLTYNNLVWAAGHIKQTEWISYMEAGINISISVILVKLYGIIGAAIGTLLAFVFNTIANYNYVNKKILKMHTRQVITMYVLNVGLCAVFLFASIHLLPDVDTIGSLFFLAILVFAVIIITTCFFNYLDFPKLTGEVFGLLIKKGKREK